MEVKQNRSSDTERQRLDVSIPPSTIRVIVATCLRVAVVETVCAACLYDPIGVIVVLLVAIWLAALAVMFIDGASLEAAWTEVYDDGMSGVVEFVDATASGVSMDTLCPGLLGLNLVALASCK